MLFNFNKYGKPFAVKNRVFWLYSFFVPLILGLVIFFSLHSNPSFILDDKITNYIYFVYYHWKWDALKLGDYTYKLEILCVCPPNVTIPRFIEVLDGISNYSFSNLEEPYENDLIKLLSELNTIDNLFLFIRKAIGEADYVYVEYDPENFYPVDIFIDYVIAGKHDELSLYISNFQIEGQK